MSEFDGLWQVERLGGALPPLAGVRKRIAGDRGYTALGRVRIPFDVQGRRLRYRPPLHSLVDELEPDEGGFRGRATIAGREYGQFALRRVASERTKEEAMEQARDQLIKHLDEGIAMEQNVVRMLDSMIQTTDDQEIKEALRQHKLETERHADLLRERLESHGASPSIVREASGIVGAMMKGVLDLTRSERAGRNARDAYATEHMEIASYELLERIAQRAGDEQTVEVARRNRADEERMAQTIAANWDRFAELSLAETMTRA